MISHNEDIVSPIKGEHKLIGISVCDGVFIGVFVAVSVHGINTVSVGITGVNVHVVMLGYGFIFVTVVAVTNDVGVNSYPSSTGILWHADNVKRRYKTLKKERGLFIKDIILAGLKILDYRGVARTV
jgi:hypothetical protein